MDFLIYGIYHIRGYSYYSLTAEYLMLGIAIVMLFFMLYTRPRISIGYPLVLLGMFISIAEIILTIDLCVITERDTQINFLEISILIFAIIVFYNYILQSILMYIVLLAPNRRIQKKNIIIQSIIFQMQFFIAALICYFKGYLVTEVTNRVYIDGLFRFLAIEGISVATISFVSSILNRKNLSRFVSINILLFCPIDALALVCQIINSDTIILSVTYVLPFTIFYMLFHSNPVDEVTGCMNRESLESKIKLLLLAKLDFYFAYVKYPQLNNILDNEIVNKIDGHVAYAVNYLNRKIRHTTVFKVNATDYVVVKKICRGDKSEDLEYFLTELNKVMNYATTAFDEITYFKAICYRKNSLITSIKDIKEINRHLLKNYTTEFNTKEFVYLDDKKIKKYAQERQIISVFEEIREGKKYLDERVLCYAQPILRVSDKKFRAAEALMRLEINGQKIPPDMFIRLAESRGFIHTLTLCMVTKVCEFISKYDSKYEFDAITINISATELSDSRFFSDIMSVIKKYNIACNKIRLEITESEMFEKHDVVKLNVEKLRDAGIEFYLDDYGTGYSNLERMTSQNFMTIKFDKSIFYKSLSNKYTEEMLEAIIELVKKQGIVTLVEGVETEEQSSFAKEKGFEYIQGFAYARPVPIEELVEYFNEK